MLTFAIIGALAGVRKVGILGYMVRGQWKRIHDKYIGQRSQENILQGNNNLRRNVQINILTCKVQGLHNFFKYIYKVISYRTIKSG